MTDLMCAADILTRAAADVPHHGLHFSKERAEGSEYLSYTELLRETQYILGGLERFAKAPGTPIALLLEQPRQFIPAFWACVLGGFIPCPLAPIRNDADRWSKHLAHVDQLLGRPLFVSTGGLLDELPDSVNRVNFNELRSGPPQERIHRAQSSDIAIFMLTSGSTGNSKAVALSHANLLASMAGRAERQQLSSNDLMFNWIAFDHVAALLESHMIATHVGARQLHVEPAVVLEDPLNFLRLIDRFNVTVAFAPNFLLGQINTAMEGLQGTRDERLSVNLSRLRRIVTGGEANVVDTGRRFLEFLAPYGLARTALWPAFGMTETCAASVYSDGFPDADIGREFAAVGRPIRGLQIRIVDEHGKACPDGEAGELQVSGTMIFNEYFNNPEATRAAFTDDKWFRTGDVGRVEAGSLSLLARTKDSIIVNGVNYFSHELECKLEQLDGIVQAYVAVFPIRPRGADTERLVVTFATTLEHSDEQLYQLLVAVRDTTIMLWGFRPAVILPLAKGAFPKTSLGKIQRTLLRKRFEAGEFSAQLDDVARLVRKHAGEYAPPHGPMEEAVAKIFADTLGVDVSTLSATANFFDMGGTSLDILKLTRALEKRVNFKGGLRIVLQNPSARQLAAHISARTGPTSLKYDPLVPLQQTGRKPPLFCVHPGNGEIFALVNVAKYFVNDRPFIALRAPGFNPGERFFSSFDDAVRTYTDAIVGYQERGPYAIAGYSLGFGLALEVAKELERRGHDVAFLGCIDARPRAAPVQLSFHMATGLALVTDLISRADYEKLNRELRPELPSHDECEYILRHASAERMAELNMDIETFYTWSRVAHAMEVLLYSRPTTGPVRSMAVFRSEGYLERYLPEWSSTAKWRNELSRWDDVAAHTRHIDVAGHHLVMMGPKYVSSFQTVLRSEIDLAFERFTSEHPELTPSPQQRAAFRAGMHSTG